MLDHTLHFNHSSDVEVSPPIATHVPHASVPTDVVAAQDYMRRAAEMLEQTDRAATYGDTECTDAS